MAAERPSSFPSAEKNQKAVAASAASDVSGLGWTILTAPAEAKKT